jgi:hypothetical protein
VQSKICISTAFLNRLLIVIELSHFYIPKNCLRYGRFIQEFFTDCFTIQINSPKDIDVDMVRKAMTGNLQCLFKNSEDQLKGNCNLPKDGTVLRPLPSKAALPTGEVVETMKVPQTQKEIEKSRNYVKFEEMVDSELNELLTLSDKPVSKSESNLYQKPTKVDDRAPKDEKTKPNEPKARFTMLAKDSGVLELMEIGGVPPVPKNPNLPWKLQTSKSEGSLAEQEPTGKALPELPRKVALSPVIKRRLNQLFPRENNTKKGTHVDNFVPASPLRNLVTKDSPVKENVPLNNKGIPVIDITTPSRFEASLEEVESPTLSSIQTSSPQNSTGILV